MEDFVTWVDSSKIKQHVMNYNEEVRGGPFSFTFLYLYYKVFLTQVNILYCVK